MEAVTIGPFKVLFSEAITPDTVIVVQRGPAMDFFRRHSRNIKPGAILDATQEEMKALKSAVKIIKIGELPCPK